MPETLSPGGDFYGMPVVQSAIHYTSVMSLTEAICLVVALVVVAWAYARHRRAAAGVMALGLLLLIVRYALAMWLLQTGRHLLWAFTCLEWAGVFGVGLVAAGCVLRVREKGVPQPVMACAGHGSEPTDPVS